MVIKFCGIACCDRGLVEEGEGIFWEAPYASGSHVCLYAWYLRKETPKGYWISRSETGARKWKTKEKICRTKDEAVARFYHRKRAHARHAWRRFRAALGQLDCVAKELGVVPFSKCFALSGDGVLHRAAAAAGFFEMTALEVK